VTPQNTDAAARPSEPSESSQAQSKPMITVNNGAGAFPEPVTPANAQMGTGSASPVSGFKMASKVPSHVQAGAAAFEKIVRSAGMTKQQLEEETIQISQSPGKVKRDSEKRASQGPDGRASTTLPLRSSMKKNDGEETAQPVVVATRSSGSQQQVPPPLIPITKHTSSNGANGGPPSAPGAKGFVKKKSVVMVVADGDNDDDDSPGGTLNLKAIVPGLGEEHDQPISFKRASAESISSATSSYTMSQILEDRRSRYAGAAVPKPPPPKAAAPQPRPPPPIAPHRPPDAAEIEEAAKRASANSGAPAASGAGHARSSGRETVMPFAPEDVQREDEEIVVQSIKIGRASEKDLVIGGGTGSQGLSAAKSAELARRIKEDDDDEEQDGSVVKMETVPQPLALPNLLSVDNDEDDTAVSKEKSSGSLQPPTLSERTPRDSVQVALSKVNSMASDKSPTSPTSPFSPYTDPTPQAGNFNPMVHTFTLSLVDSQTSVNGGDIDKQPTVLLDTSRNTQPPRNTFTAHMKSVKSDAIDEDQEELLSPKSFMDRVSKLPSDALSVVQKFSSVASVSQVASQATFKEWCARVSAWEAAEGLRESVVPELLPSELALASHLLDRQSRRQSVLDSANNRLGLYIDGTNGDAKSAGLTEEGTKSPGQRAREQGAAALLAPEEPSVGKRDSFSMPSPRSRSTLTAQSSDGGKIDGSTDLSGRSPRSGPSGSKNLGVGSQSMFGGGSANLSGSQRLNPRTPTSNLESSWRLARDMGSSRGLNSGARPLFSPSFTPGMQPPKARGIHRASINVNSTIVAPDQAPSFQPPQLGKKGALGLPQSAPRASILRVGGSGGQGTNMILGPGPGMKRPAGASNAPMHLTVFNPDGEERKNSYSNVEVGAPANTPALTPIPSPSNASGGSGYGAGRKSMGPRGGGLAVPGGKGGLLQRTASHEPGGGQASDSGSNRYSVCSAITNSARLAEQGKGVRRPSHSADPPGRPSYRMSTMGGNLNLPAHLSGHGSASARGSVSLGPPSLNHSNSRRATTANAAVTRDIATSQERELANPNVAAAAYLQGRKSQGGLGHGHGSSSPSRRSFATHGHDNQYMPGRVSHSTRASFAIPSPHIMVTASPSDALAVNNMMQGRNSMMAGGLGGSHRGSVNVMGPPSTRNSIRTRSSFAAPNNPNHLGVDGGPGMGPKRMMGSRRTIAADGTDLSQLAQLGDGQGHGEGPIELGPPSKGTGVRVSMLLGGLLDARKRKSMQVGPPMGNNQPGQPPMPFRGSFHGSFMGALPGGPGGSHHPSLLMPGQGPGGPGSLLPPGQFGPSGSRRQMPRLSIFAEFKQDGIKNLRKKSENVQKLHPHGFQDPAISGLDLAAAQIKGEGCRGALGNMKRWLLTSMHRTFKQEVWQGCSIINPLDKTYFMQERTKKLQKLTEASSSALSPAVEQAVRNSLSASRQSIENR